MKNLKLELFNFKKDLTLDQEEVSVIVEGHMNACNQLSEKQIIVSLNERLKPYTYDKSVKSLLENLNDDMKNYELLYELKFLKEQEDKDEARIVFLQSLLQEHDMSQLHSLLMNDETTVRFALIEKYARIGAMEMLIDGKYTIDTLNTITQFPLADYQLIVKRIQELVALISDITTQASSMASGVAGL